MYLCTKLDLNNLIFAKVFYLISLNIFRFNNAKPFSLEYCSVEIILLLAVSLALYKSLKALRNQFLKTTNSKNCCYKFNTFRFFAVILL